MEDTETGEMEMKEKIDLLIQKSNGSISKKDLEELVRQAVLDELVSIQKELSKEILITNLRNNYNIIEDLINYWKYKDLIP